MELLCLDPESGCAQNTVPTVRILSFYFTAQCLIFFVYKMETTVVPTLYALKEG